MQRRSFLRTSAAALALPAVTRGVAANSSVSVAVIGCSRTPNGGPGRGTELALGLIGVPGVSISYLCDVDNRHLARAMEAVAEKGARPKPERDFRRILGDKSVDAVVIATPDHWHTPAAVLTCDAGKHVYLETPCTQSGQEGDLLLSAAGRSGRVVQHGTQRRSWPVIQEAIAKLRDGAIGRVLSAKALYYNTRLTIGQGHNAPVPPDFDWDLWQGPAPDRPFHDNYVPFNWRWFWQWGTGEIGSSGLPLLDLCRWGMAVDIPLRTTSGGAKLRFKDDQETPDAQTATFDFVGEAITTISYEARSWTGRTLHDPKYDVAFYGEEGSLLITGSGYGIYDPQGKEMARGAGSGGNESHLRNWIEAIRGNARLNSPIEDGVKSAMMCHLANASWRASRAVLVDVKTRKIVEDPAVLKFWKREYRIGWTPAG